MKRLDLTVFLFLLTLPIFSWSQESDPGIDTVQLEKFLEICADTKADKLLLFHQGNKIAGWQNPDCDSVYMNTASMVKSWAALGIGILINQGKIESIDDPVCKYTLKWAAGCTGNVTIRQLMNMTSGLLKRPARESVLAQADMNTFVSQLELDTIPGSKWSYSNESVQLLAILIEDVSGKSVSDFFAEQLFAPLGMDSTTLYQDEAGNGILFGGCRTTVEDVAQIGLLMANEGVHEGKQFLPESWIGEITSPSEVNPYYGLLWWLNTENGNYAAMGDFGQMIIVFPELELVFIRQQSCANTDPSQNMRWMGPAFLEELRKVVDYEKAD